MDTGRGVEGAARVTEELTARIVGVARERRRDRLLVELACIEWELSHLDSDTRAEVEDHLARTFSVPSFGVVLEDSIRGRSTGAQWVLLCYALGL